MGDTGRDLPVKIASVLTAGEKRLLGDDWPEREVDEVENANDWFGEVESEYIE
jgi:hypothetical protein